MNVSSRHVALLFIVTVCLVLGGGQCPPENNGPDATWSSGFTTDGSWMLSVAGRSSDQIYAVGGAARPPPGDAEVRKYDGDSWTTVSIPEDVPLLTWVHCFSNGRPVMAGEKGTVLWKREDGWEVDTVPNEPKLWGVWGPSPDDVWAVGRTDDRANPEPVVYRYDGSSWSKRTIPDLGRNDVESLFKVWGTGSDNVYFVGDKGTLLHWNGQSIEDESPSTDRDLIALWGTGPDNIVAVGGRQTGGVLARWDGSSWSTRSLDPLYGTNGIWVPDESTAWVAGAEGKVARVDLDKDPSDDNSKTVKDLDTDLQFHAIYGLKGTGLFAVAANLSRPGGPYRGAAWRRSRVD